MNEKNIILIAALGFGAFFLLTRKPAAATVSPYTLGAGTGAAQTAAPSTKNTLLTGLLGLAGGLIQQNRATAAPTAQSTLADFAYSGWGGLDFSAMNSPYSTPTLSSGAATLDYGNLTNPFDLQWGAY